MAGTYGQPPGTAVGTSDARLNESGATKSRRQIHLRYDRDDRPDQRGTTETTAGQQTNTEHTPRIASAAAPPMRRPGD
jgi:hypothetical protein